MLVETLKPPLTTTLTTLPSLHLSYKACCCKLSGQAGQSLAPSDKNVHNSRLCSEFSKITQIMQEIIMEKKKEETPGSVPVPSHSERLVLKAAWEENQFFFPKCF